MESIIFSNSQPFRAAIAFAMCLVAALAHAKADDWVTINTGDKRFIATRDYSWALIETTADHLTSVQQTLSEEGFENINEIRFLESTRLMVQFATPIDEGHLRKTLSKLVGVGRVWFALRRSDGIKFVDDRFVLKHGGQLPVALLKKMGVVCNPDPFIPHVYDCRTSTSDVISVVNTLGRTQPFEWVEPNYLSFAKLHHEIRDPSSVDQWHLGSQGGEGGIQAKDAWWTTTGRPEVVIAVVDSGAQLTHPELSPKLVGGFDAVSNDDDPSPECTAQQDGQGPVASCPRRQPYRESHGTAVAGVAVAAANGQYGTGVCPDCSLYMVRLIGDTGGLRSLSSGQTFQRLTDANVWVVNNSWGPNLSQFFPLPRVEDEALTRLSTEGRYGLGAVVLFAAGNEFMQSADINPYAAHPGIITVSASTRGDDFACYSNIGSSISISAPSKGCLDTETGLLTADIQGGEGYSPTNTTNDFGGTSAAAPVAAGLAGLILSSNPALTADEVRLVMELTAEKIETKIDWNAIVGQDLRDVMRYDEYGYSRFFGYGRINAKNAVTLAESLGPDGFTGSCEKDCSLCHKGKCAMPCQTDAECLGSHRCESTDAGQICTRPRVGDDTVGQPCGPDCEICIRTLTTNFSETSLCSRTCAQDDECPFGFDCRLISSTVQACVPGPKSCGELYNSGCASRVAVSSGSENVCSCDCVDGVDGACPETMACANAYCYFGRGGLVCEPVDSPYSANELPKCFPKTRTEVTCERHMDCGYGLFCIDNKCAIDRDGCDTCAECIESSDCGEDSSCVATARGRRCLRACSDSAECGLGTHCVAPSQSEQTYCVNDDSERKGICPRNWRCPLADRCLLTSDCPADCECSTENTCECPETPMDAGVLEADAGPIDFLQPADATGCMHTRTPITLVSTFLLGIIGLRRCSRRVRDPRAQT